ncbi:MAG: hypothetical protein QG672_574, partial [Pseudomonadota bacterium]|nr:hypothetical protein [Pseudomonadota bacterium]
MTTFRQNAFVIAIALSLAAVPGIG